MLFISSHILVRVSTYSNNVKRVVGGLDFPTVIIFHCYIIIPILQIRLMKSIRIKYLALGFSVIKWWSAERKKKRKLFKRNRMEERM